MKETAKDRNSQPHLCIEMTRITKGISLAEEVVEGRHPNGVERIAEIVRFDAIQNRSILGGRIFVMLKVEPKIAPRNE